MKIKIQRQQPAPTAAATLIELRQLLKAAAQFINSHDKEFGRSFGLRSEWVIRAIAKLVLLK